LKIWGFYCGFPSIWADFLRFVYAQTGRKILRKLRVKKTDFSKSNAKDKRKGMED
jgi:hypothetical protein